MIDWNAKREELIRQKEAIQRRAEVRSDKIDLPPGVTIQMVEAGLIEWDAATHEGVRLWPTMLGRIYAAMKAASTE